MNRSAKRLLIVTTNLDGFSLANHGWFAKFAKLSPHQTFLLYGTSCFSFIPTKILFTWTFNTWIFSYTKISWFMIQAIKLCKSHWSATIVIITDEWLDVKGYAHLKDGVHTVSERG